MDARTSICTAQSQLGLRAGIALALLAAAFSAARAETVVSNAFGRLAVNFCREDLVHFRYAPGGAEFTPQAVYVARQAIEKTDADYAPVKVRESRRIAERRPSRWTPRLWGSPFPLTGAWFSEVRQRPSRRTEKGAGPRSCATSPARSASWGSATSLETTSSRWSCAT